jgi:hypothetical protein
VIAALILTAHLISGNGPGATVAGPHAVIYEVQPGDSLWAIAGREIGDSARWPQLYARNRGTIGQDPDLIFPGERLWLSVRLADQPVWASAGQRSTDSDLGAARSGTPAARPLDPGRAAGSIPSGQLDCAGLERLWTAAGGSPDAAFMAAEIAMAESGGYQYAHSPTDDYGYWQINGSHGYLATYDAYGNARAAVIISGDGTDWYPWTTYTSGAYIGRC